LTTLETMSEVEREEERPLELLESEEKLEDPKLDDPELEPNPEELEEPNPEEELPKLEELDPELNPDPEEENDEPDPEDELKPEEDDCCFSLICTNPSCTSLVSVYPMGPAW